MTETAEVQKDAKKGSPGLNFLIDFAPLLTFFLVYRFSDPGENPITAIVKGTLAFMVAIVIAVAVSRIKMGKVSPMLWLSAILILGFGALTVYFRDATFIQIKPTIIYAGFAAILFGGLMRGKAMLKYLLQAAFDGLSDTGWRKLSRNWGLFFLFLGVLNEVLRYLFNQENGKFDTWLTLKVWGVTTLSLVFTFSQIPMLMRHGLVVEDDKTDKEKADP